MRRSALVHTTVRLPNAIAYHPQVTRQRRNQVAELYYTQHVSKRQIARELGITHPTVIRDLARWDADQAEQTRRAIAGEPAMQPQPPVRWLTPAERRAAARSRTTRQRHAKRLREQYGLSYRQIAAELGVSASTAYADLHP